MYIFLYVFAPKIKMENLKKSLKTLKKDNGDGKPNRVLRFMEK